MPSEAEWSDASTGVRRAPPRCSLLSALSALRLATGIPARLKASSTGSRRLLVRARTAERTSRSLVCAAPGASGRAQWPL